MFNRSKLTIIPHLFAAMKKEHSIQLCLIKGDCKCSLTEDEPQRTQFSGTFPDKIVSEVWF